MLVLEANHEAARRGLGREPVERRDDAIETAGGIDGAPVGEHPDDAGARLPRDRKGPFGELRLIRERVARPEDILLQTLVDGGASGSSHLSTGDAIDRMRIPRAATSAFTRSTSSSERSRMFLPQITRSSTPVMPISAMAEARSRDRVENSSVMAARVSKGIGVSQIA